MSGELRRPREAGAIESTEPARHGHLTPDDAAASARIADRRPPRRTDPPSKDPHDEPDRRRADRPVESPRRRPEEHELRGRQHVREGHRDRPGHRRARRAAVGEGLGRRPRHADRVRASRCCASTGCARSSTSTRASTARTRWSPRSTTACTARAARLPRSTPRCTASSMPRTSTTCIPTRASRSRPSKDGAKLTKKAFGEQGGVGAVAPPRLPARTRHRRDQGEEPRGDRLHPRRPRHHRVGRHVGGGRGELAVDHRDRAGLHRRERQEGAVRQGAREVRRAARGRAPREGRGARRDDPRHRVARQADGRALHRRPAGARVPRVGEGAEARRARHQLPRPLPAHQGQADAARPALGRARREGDRAAQGAARGLPRRLHGVLREARDGRVPRDPRRRPAHRARARVSACSATARTSRPPASPASSTSTRST